MASGDILLVADDPTLYPVRLIVGRTILEVSEALGFEQEPLILPDFDMPGALTETELRFAYGDR